MKAQTKFIVAVGILFLLLCPFSITVSPISNIRVVDSFGTPVSGVMIYHGWEHFGSGAHDGETKSTDKNGYVTFEPRSTRVIPLFQIIHMLLPLISPHTSNGTQLSFDIKYPPDFEPALAESAYMSRSQTDTQSVSPDSVYVDKNASRVMLSYYNRHDAIEFTFSLRKKKQTVQ